MVATTHSSSSSSRIFLVNKIFTSTTFLFLVLVILLLQSQPCLGWRDHGAPPPEESQSSNSNNRQECKAKSFTSCEECLRTGCIWNPDHGFCYEQEVIKSGKKLKWTKGKCPQANKSSHVFTDPLYEAQEWVYNMMNVESVWKQGLTGKGITIQVVDSGVDGTHPEFAGRFNAEKSCNRYMPTNGREHGTNVASIALGGANNGLCATGIAPDATLTACYHKEGLQKSIETADISNNSWGQDACKRIVKLRRYDFPKNNKNEKCPLPKESSERAPLNSMACAQLLDKYCRAAKEFSKAKHINKLNLDEDPNICKKYRPNYIKCEMKELTPEKLAVLEEGIKKGRNGKGVIYVFASGNEHNKGETINMEGYLRSRYTITVGGVKKKSDEHASYTTPGAAALFISAPGGDEEYLTNFITAKAGGGCHDATYGSSFATPAVSGGIALMLQANPDLGWRDVQGILAKTARKIHKTSNSKYWKTNGAGFSHHPYYGFGLIDVGAAVKLAKQWKNWGEEEYITVETPNMETAIIRDDAKKALYSKLIVPDKGLVMESVVVSLNVQHPDKGQLRIQLISPHGTRADLMPGGRGDSWTGDKTWSMMSLVTWGENPTGKWKLKISDTVKGDGMGQKKSGSSKLVSWKLTVYGHKA